MSNLDLSKYKTAHDLAADWGWMDCTTGFRVRGGRVVWEEAQYLERGAGLRVRLARLDTSGGSLREYHRWVDPDMPIELIPYNG